MNTLQKLREAHQKRCKTVNVCGVEVGLKPLTVAEAQPLIAQFSDVAGLKADDPRLVGLYVELIARCAVEPGTSEKALDSDDGRAMIRDLPMGELFDLGFTAAEVSGLGGKAADAKKN